MSGKGLYFHRLPQRIRMIAHEKSLEHQALKENSSQFKVSDGYRNLKIVAIRTEERLQLSGKFNDSCSKIRKYEFGYQAKSTFAENENKIKPPIAHDNEIP